MGKFSLGLGVWRKFIFLFLLFFNWFKIFVLSYGKFCGENIGIVK